MMSDRIKEIIKLNEEHAKVYDNVAIFNFYKKHLQDVKSKVGDYSGNIILDAGCGTGNLKQYINNAYYIGLDISREMLRKARQKFSKSENCDFILGDAQYLPLKDSCTDAIVSINVLYQLSVPEKFLEDSNRVLKEDGSLVISTPYSKSTFHGLEKAGLSDILKILYLL